MHDWIDDFMLRTANVPSPKEFRLWAAITTVSAALERKCWTSASGGAFYPNLYTVLVGGPGCGKSQSISVTRFLWSHVKDLAIAPDSVTRASLMQDLAKSIRTVTMPDGKVRIFSALAIACREFNTLFPNYDRDFCAAINDLFDNPPEYRQTRIYSGNTSIQAPTLTFLAAVTPDTLGDTLPEPAWGSGFTARLMLIYASEKTEVDFFAERDEDENLMYRPLIPGLQKIFDLRGPFKWTEEAKDAVRKWDAEDLAPVPEHSRLRHYLTRRRSHTIKLAMISAASARCELTVHASDFYRAKGWILDAETRMPDIFRSMGQKSDAQLIKDLHFNLYQMWASVAREKRRPIPEAKIYQFLQERVPSERIEKIIEIAERTGCIRNMGGAWEPRPLGTF